jgi:hypothetical protein
MTDTRYSAEELRKMAEWAGSSVTERMLRQAAADAETLAGIRALHTDAISLRREYLRWVQGPNVAPDEPFLAALDTFTDALREWVADQNRETRRGSPEVTHD